MSGVVDSRLSQLEPAWCQEMLRSHGFGGVVLTTVDAEPMSVSGAVADMARLRVGYNPLRPLRATPSSKSAAARQNRPDRSGTPTSKACRGCVT